MDASQVQILTGNARGVEPSVLAIRFAETHFKLAMKFVTLETRKDVKIARK